MPRTYPTLQEAMLAFLIDRVARNEFPYSYKTWLRAAVLIVADAQHDPEWLHVIACDWDPMFFEGEPADSPRRHEPGLEKHHIMTISDDWSCLSQDTFEFVTQTYAGKEGA